MLICQDLEKLEMVNSKLDVNKKRFDLILETDVWPPSSLSNKYITLKTGDS